MSDFPLKWPFPVLPTKAILQDLECLKGPALPPSLATHPWSHLPSWNSHRPHPSQYQSCYISHGGCPFTAHTANRIPVGPAPLCPCLPVLFFFFPLFPCLTPHWNWERGEWVLHQPQGPVTTVLPMERTPCDPPLPFPNRTSM